MSKSALIFAFGNPRSIHSNSYGAPTQYVFSRGTYSQFYVYFEGGSDKVSNWQN